MALLWSESEQVAVLFEVMSARADWVFVHIAFQHYVTKENDFATWAGGLAQSVALRFPEPTKSGQPVNP